MSVIRLLARLENLGIQLWAEDGCLRYRARDDAVFDGALREEVRRNEAALVRFLEDMRGSVERPKIPRAPQNAPIPASFAQERFLFLHRLSPSSAAYNLVSLFAIEGELDIEALRRAIAAIGDRHAILRTSFEMSSPVPTQRIVAETTPLEVLDWSDEGHTPANLSGTIEREGRRPFALERGPCIRTTLFRLAARDHRLLVVMHHIVSDDGSIPLFVNELRELYAAHRDGRPARLPPLRRQFGDFAWWERHCTQALIERQVEFWKRHLAQPPEANPLPRDLERVAASTPRAETVLLELDEAMVGKAVARADTSGITTFHCVLTAFALALHAAGNTRDIVVGIPVRHRQSRDVQDLIGPFINVLPVRIAAAPDWSLCAATRSVRDVMLNALENADVPFERIVQAVSPRRTPDRPPLFQALFAFEDTPVGILDLPGLRVRTLQVEDQSVKSDLALVVQRHGGKLRMSLKYDATAFSRRRMQAVAATLNRLLVAMAEDPHARASAICESPMKAQACAVAAEDGPVRNYRTHLPLHHLFREQAFRSPREIAIRDAAGSWTYDELDRHSEAVAARLKARLPRSGGRVAMCVERSRAMVSAFIGILKAGAAFVPIDPDYPRERRRFMLADCKPHVLIATADCASDLGWTGPSLALDDIAAHPLASPLGPVSAPAGCACAILYTSGSTGTPKGVVLSHAAMANNLAWMQDEWPLSAEDILMLKAPIGFDIFVKEVFWPLLNGASILVAPAGAQGDLAYVKKAIAGAGVSVAHLVPSVLRRFLEDEVPDWGRLRILMCGGEALSHDLLRDFQAKSRAAMLHLYGPTEAAIAVSGEMYRSVLPEGGIALGRPMPNARIRILDEALERVPVGAPGEICIGGLPLADGYWSNAALTAQRFVPDPYSPHGERLYRTGDLGMWLDDGRFKYLGRSDRQLKVRGVRIEPGEIESVLRQHPSVRDAVVCAREHPLDGQRLHAYVVLRDPAARIAPVRAFLRERLPLAWIPEHLQAIAEIPLGPHGKLDMSKLPAPAWATKPAAAAMDATSMEAIVSAIWRDVLARDVCDPDESFFDAGGNSISLMRVQTALGKAIGRDVPLSTLFLHPTIASLAAHLSHDDVARPEATPRTPAARSSNALAIVGWAGRFPGADDIDAFWRNIAEGRECIRFFDDAELRAAGFPEHLLTDPRLVRARGALDDSDLFDGEFFGLSNRDSDLLDPQVRLLLECTQLAFDDAACDATSFQAKGRRIAAYVAVSRSTYFLNVLSRDPKLFNEVGAQQIAIATDKSFAATHLAFRFGLRGPCMTVDTACSSSLVAVHEACEALLRGDADLAIAAGSSVDAPMAGGYLYQDGNIGARDGHCRPFDAAAGGTVKGSGVGVVLLKRMEDAIAAGDAVHAIVKGIAINNDGADKMTFTAPSQRGQAEVIASALARAAVAPDSVGYVEAHGTGTRIGDPIEMAALRAVYGSGRIALGSVKANIGHLDAAAGIAGFMKAALCVQRNLIPPLANFTTPNPELDLESGVFRVPTTAAPWTPGAPRRAAVSSFGIGGTNAHAILEEPPRRETATSGTDGELILLSALDATRLANDADALRDRLQSCPEVSLEEIACTMASRSHGPLRRAVPARSLAELAEALRHLVAEMRAPRPRLATGQMPRRRTEARVHIGFCGPFESGLAQAMQQRCAVFAPELARCTAMLADAARPAALGFAMAWGFICELRARGLSFSAVSHEDGGALLAECIAGKLAPEDAMRRIADGDDVGHSMSEPTPCGTLAPDIVIGTTRCPGGAIVFDGQRAPGSAPLAPFWAVLAAIWSCGIELEWPEHRDTARYRKTRLPPRSFDRRRHWHDAVRGPDPMQAPDSSVPSAPHPTSMEDLEATIARIWMEILGCPPGEDGNFFGAGGDSLAAVQLMARLESACGARVSLEQFFADASYPALVAAMKQATSSAAPVDGAKQTARVTIEI